MGWDNTTEMVATLVDAVNTQTRVFINANSDHPDRSPVPMVPRPYEAVVEQESVSLAVFTQLLKED